VLSLPDADPAAADGDPVVATPALQPLGAEALAQVEQLVRQAIGFNEARGDAVSVMNAPFIREAVEPLDLSVPLWEQPLLREGLRYLLGALVVLALIFGVVRPVLRGLFGPPARGGRAAVDEGELPLLTGETEGEGEDDGGMPMLPGEVTNTREQREAMLAAAKTLDEKLQLARSTVAQDPKIVAQVVKNWVAADA
jgi:flagellar M-ring protein FliF